MSNREVDVHKVVMIIAIIVGVIGGVFGMNILVQEQDQRAQHWADVPERGWEALGDLPTGTPVIVQSALDEPNDTNGLAIYDWQIEDTTTSTYTDSDGHVKTRRTTTWKTTGQYIPEMPIRFVTADSRQPVEAFFDARLIQGPARYIYMDHETRVVGWSQGDALLLVGTIREPHVIDATIVTSQSREQFIGSLRSTAFFGRFIQAVLVVLGIILIAGVVSQ